MIIIDGKKIAAKIIADLKEQPRPTKKLVAVLVGDDPSSLSFLKIKERTAAELGVEFQLHHLEAGTEQAVVEQLVRRLSDDARVGGIIVQLPLPQHLDRDAILVCIDRKKDVDALTVDAIVAAPAVEVVKVILKDLRLRIEDLGVIAVVGRGFLVGEPIIKWLANESLNSLKFKGLKLKTADIETKNLQKFVADADLIITGVGKAGLIQPEWLKDGAGVIDFGYPADLVQPPLTLPSQLSFYTPTPGGTGPILVAALFRNFYQLCG